MDAALIGKTLDGRYRILDKIAQGGMGAVYRAEHLGTGREVAVKVVLADDDEAHLNRFHREARAVGKVKTRHIAQVFDTGNDEEGRPFMVMELMEGQDLHALLKKVKLLSPEVALAIGAQVCRGLAEAHQVGLVHRDVKPANIFLSEQDGEVVVKLLDFGVAKLSLDQAQKSGDLVVTQAGALLGSPQYMAPEQARGKEDVDARADIWSLGVVLYRMMSGETPFSSAESLGDLIITLCSKSAPPLREVAPWVQAEAAEIVGKALRIERDERFASAREMGDRLAGLLLSTRLAPEMLCALDDATRGQFATGAPALAPTKPPPALADGGTLAAAGIVRGGLAAAPIRPSAPDPVVQMPFAEDPFKIESVAPEAVASTDAPASSLDAPRQVEAAIAGALARRGVGGKVVVRGNIAEIHADGPPVGIDLGEWVAQWNLLPAEMHDRRAEVAAARLQAALREARGESDRTKIRWRPWIERASKYLFVLGVALAIGFWLLRSGFFGSSLSLLMGEESEPSAKPFRPETSDEAAARIIRACDAGRRRLYAGAALGIDHEGWVVELWLARPAAQGALATDPAVKRALSQGMLDGLGAAGPGSVALAKLPRANLGMSTVGVVLSGAYTSKFFGLRGREDLIGAADKLAEDAQATHAALYGRCAHLPASHDIGAWYRGVGDAEAVGALLFAAGLFADPPIVSQARLEESGGVLGLVPPDPFKTSDLGELLKKSGARISRRPSSDERAAATAFRFPAGGPVLALRVSRALAKQLLTAP